jgi:hypothetical protein
MSFKFSTRCSTDKFLALFMFNWFCMIVSPTIASRIEEIIFFVGYLIVISYMENEKETKK